MMRSMLAIATTGLMLAVAVASAQAKPAKTSKPAASTKAAGSKKAPAAGKTAATTKNAQSANAGGKALDIAPPPSDTAAPPSLMREAFVYSRDGRRDPFVSLLTTDELRPAISDLRLTSVLYDPSGAHSLAILRDLGTNAQYRVTEGSTLGRMRVSAIRVKTVVFTIEEFGTTRRDSLVMGDSIKVRGK